MGFEYGIIVKNKTRLENLIERFNTKAQAKFYIESSGGNFSEYVEEHEIFQESLLSLQVQLSKFIKNKTIERSFLPSFIFSNQHIILVIGQDGLVANTAKYSNSCPIVAVNPDKNRYDGILLPFQVNNFTTGIESVLNGNYSFKTMHFAEAKLNNGQKLLAFNDLFIGTSSHISSRYRINFNGQSEEHSSSGIIVSTKAGSSGWLSSMYNMAHGLLKSIHPDEVKIQPKLKNKDLIFVVREPFKSKKTQIDICYGLIKENSTLQIESYMPNSGVIFSDGIESDFIHFNSGSIVSIGLANETAKLVLNNHDK